LSKLRKLRCLIIDATRWFIQPLLVLLTIAMRTRSLWLLMACSSNCKFFRLGYNILADFRKVSLSCQRSRLLGCLSTARGRADMLKSKNIKCRQSKSVVRDPLFANKPNTKCIRPWSRRILFQDRYKCEGHPYPLMNLFIVQHLFVGDFCSLLPHTTI
jgi:hypothetical protein